MKKILLVQFAPGKNSETQKLINYFLEKNNNVKIINLAKNLPPLFDEKIASAYGKKYFGKIKLNKKENNYLKKMEKLASEFSKAQKIIIAYPMYNHSIPAAVKAYFDAVMIPNFTWKMENKKVVGLMKKTSALIISTTGISYNKREMKNKNHSTPLVKQMLEFMGLKKIKIIEAQGLNSRKTNKEKVMENTKKEIQKIAYKWK